MQLDNEILKAAAPKTIIPSAEIAEIFRKTAKENEVFNAIFYKLAHRLRNRDNLSVKALKTAMDKEGSHFKDEDYRKFLNFLSALGIGKPKIGTNGKLVELNKIQVPLQSIGQAASARVPELKLPEKVEQKAPAKVKEQHYIAKMTVMIGTTMVPMPNIIFIPPGELGEFLVEFTKMTERLSEKWSKVK